MVDVDVDACAGGDDGEGDESCFDFDEGRIEETLATVVMPLLG